MLVPCLLLLGTLPPQAGSESDALGIALAAPAQLFADPADRGLLALVGDLDRQFPTKVTALVPLRNLLLQPGLPGVTVAPEDFGAEWLGSEVQPLVVVRREDIRFEVGREGKDLRLEAWLAGDPAQALASLPPLHPLEPADLSGFRAEVPLALLLRGESGPVGAPSDPAVDGLTGGQMVVLVPRIDGWLSLLSRGEPGEEAGWWFGREGRTEEQTRWLDGVLDSEPVPVPGDEAGEAVALARLDPEPLVELLAGEQRAALVEAAEGSWPEPAQGRGAAWVRVWREGGEVRISGHFPGSWSRYWPLVEYLASERLKAAADSGLGRARAAKVQADLRTILQAARHFRVLNGSYPGSLQVLVTPDVNGERFLAYESVPLDPWGREYRYALLGGGSECEVFTLGADGIEGGTGEDADLSVGHVE